MRKRSTNREAVRGVGTTFGRRVPITEGRQDVTAERSSHELDDLEREVREVAKRLVLDLAILAERAAKQMRRVSLTLVLAACSGDVDGTFSSRHRRMIAQKCSLPST